MSTRQSAQQAPGLLLLFLISFTFTVGVLALELLGYLSSSLPSANAGTAQFWPVLLGVFMPATAVTAVVVYLYATNDR